MNTLERAKNISDKLRDVKKIDDKIKDLSELQKDVVIIIRNEVGKSTSVKIEDKDITSQIVEKVRKMLNEQSQDKELDLEELLTS